uniref:Golgin-84 n=1 Tax=Steinernema glaseri TaxID=37863 RepID=A0A1I7ZFA4_9BILA
MNFWLRSRTRDLDDLRKQLSNFENKVSWIVNVPYTSVQMMMLNQEVASMRSTVDRHSNDIMAVNSDVRSRPQVDPTKIANSNQQLEMKLRDIQGQLMQFKQTMDAEIADRVRVNQAQAENINRLQEYIRQQEASKNDLLQSLSRKGDQDQKKLSDESKRLNDRIQLITTEVNKNTTEREHRLREEMNQKINSLQSVSCTTTQFQHPTPSSKCSPILFYDTYIDSKVVKSDIDSRTASERENRKKQDDRFKAMNDAVEAMKVLQQTDKTKNKERFQKINEALATLEHHLEIGDKKVDKIVNAEIQARKLHEKALLAKMQELEDRVNKYLDGLNKAIEDASAGKENVKVPTLDTDAVCLIRLSQI